MEIQRNILLNPGPATTTDSVKMAQVVPDICPREKEFGDLMAYISDNLTAIAQGGKEYTTILFAGSGTAAVDAMINSVVPHNTKILIINNGAYGERMVKIAKAYSIDIEEIYYPWGTYPNLHDVENKLKTVPEISCIAMVHHETTTGMLNPVAEIGQLSDKYKKMFIVDAISSFAAIPFSVQEYYIDFMASTSNKCIQGMAGCAFIIAHKQAMQKIANISPRSFYLNLYQQYLYFEKTKQMQFTPPVQTLYALRQAIQEFLEEGADQRHQRYKKSWETLIKGMKRLGFQKLLPDEYESKILTTFHYLSHPNFSFEEIHDQLYQKGFTIYPGKIGEKDTFRLANMGAIDCKDIQNFCDALEIVLQKMEIL